MEMINKFHMNGGTGDSSYANNSFIQQNAILKTKPILERAIANHFPNMVPTQIINIADLGCSCGPNTFLASSKIIEAIDDSCMRLGHKSPQVQVFLNDLPANDFNTLFRFLPQFQQTLEKERESGCFFTGVPGSFFDQLFPLDSLHFVHSSYSLHWLSQIPEGLLESNKENIYVSRTSPPSVLKAYYGQFRKDFSTFLKHRSLEVVNGGCMVLQLLGRTVEDPSNKEGTLIWDLLANALNGMVSEGRLEREKVNSLNIPIYHPCPREISCIIEEEGSFIIDHFQTSELHWRESTFNDDENEATIDEDAYCFTKCMRAVVEPMLLDHFPDEDKVVEEVFNKYHENIAICMAREKPKFINVIISMHKKTTNIAS